MVNPREVQSHSCDLLKPGSGMILQYRGMILQYRGMILQYRGMILQYRGMVLQYRGMILQYRGMILQYRGMILQYRGMILQYRTQKTVLIFFGVLKVQLDQQTHSLEKKTLVCRKTRVTF